MTKFLRLPSVSISKLILLTALFLTLLYNLAFFRNTWSVYAGEPGGILFELSLAVFLYAVTVLVLSLLCIRYLTKPLLVGVILCAAAANYFMYRYNIVVDTTMLASFFQTNTSEAGDLLTPGFFIQFFLLGILPAVLIARVPIVCQSFPGEIVRRLKLVGFALTLMIISIMPFTAYYTSFFREHKILRYYSNPATFIYSTGKYISQSLSNSHEETRLGMGQDAHIPINDTGRELIMLVVGEAVRADHFGLNGYERQTTPLLAKDKVINYSQVYSCGTATALSLPCMFSLEGRDDFDPQEARRHENLLDVLAHAGVNVLWRDNNSDSKGIADFVNYEDFRTPDNNPVCDVECRDVGMLDGLDDYIQAHPEGDIVIVLHQMGNHGPAYYKRYPQEFGTFTPACHSSQLETCSDEEIVNAYDNAILYTDYFLNQVIGFLKNHDSDFETAMYYMSDHGESLGENHLYLHGLPYFLAPENQKHVASVLWFGDDYHVDKAAVIAQTNDRLSHDNYFHTVLGLMEIKTSIYDSNMDLVVHPDS